jgi:hypothetical protein
LCFHASERNAAFLSCASNLISPSYNATEE